MSIWNNLYQAYEKKDCESFKKYFYALTEEDKKSPYFSYYASLYVKLCPQGNEKRKIMIKGKVIKCLSCGSPLTLSEYNKEQIKKLKNGEKQVEFICNYCGEKFIWSKKKFKTLFTNYSIGQEVNIKGKKYKIAGGVKYKGIYEEDNERGILKYIEWLAYDEKGKLYYIAESVAIDNYGRYESLEISEKVDFPFTVKSYNENYVETNIGTFNLKEYDEVKVVELIGDVGKGYTIGEKVKIYNFKNYSLEEEKTKNGIERNLYKIIHISENSLNNESIFGSDDSNSSFLVYFFIICIYVSIELGYYTLFLIALILFIVYLAYPKLSYEQKDYLFFIFGMVILSTTIGFFVYFFFKPKELSTIKVSNVKNIENGKYEYKFAKDISISKLLFTYDYGGKAYKKKRLEGFYFSIKDDEDKQTFKKLMENKNLFDLFKLNNTVKKVSSGRKISDIVDTKNDILVKYK